MNDLLDYAADFNADGSITERDSGVILVPRRIDIPGIVSRETLMAVEPWSCIRTRFVFNVTPQDDDAFETA